MDIRRVIDAGIHEVWIDWSEGFRIYPIGSLVRLQSGSPVVVVDQSSKSLLMPKLRGMQLFLRQLEYLS